MDVIRVDPSEIVRAGRVFCELQRRVLAALRDKLGDVWSQYVPPFWPRETGISCEGEDWACIKHGCGVRCVGSATGRVVDVPDIDRENLGAFEIFALIDYLESIGLVGELPHWSVTEKRVEAALEQAVLDGQFTKLVPAGTATKGRYVANPTRGE